MRRRSVVARLGRHSLAFKYRGKVGFRVEALRNEIGHSIVQEIKYVRARDSNGRVGFLGDFLC